MNIP
jgi:hypothetical protein